MKAIATISMALTALILSGCAHQPGPYANDPRCQGLRPISLYPWVHITGPNYLDYVMEYPRDRDTEMYRPSIYLQGVRARYLDPFPAPTNAPSEIQALLTPIPPPRQN
jgi:hypothetical protein